MKLGHGDRYWNDGPGNEVFVLYRKAQLGQKWGKKWSKVSDQFAPTLEGASEEDGSSTAWSL